MSVISQAGGAEDERAAKAGERRKVRPEAPLEVHLEHSRWRHFGWSVFGLVAGAVLIWKLGLVGKWVGAFLMLVGAWAGYHFARTLTRPPGRILIDLDKVTLPAGLCRGPEHTFDLDQVRHAFFLRRAVPWTRTGPVLVVEVAEHTFAYPRDWFASESDQRRVATVLNRYLGRLGD